MITNLLIYCQWNTREPGGFPNVSFPMFYHDNSISHLPLLLAVTYQLQSRLCTEHSRVAANKIFKYPFNSYSASIFQHNAYPRLL